jgi:RNase P subunit RPR2
MNAEEEKARQARAEAVLEENAQILASKQIGEQIQVRSVSLCPRCNSRELEGYDGYTDQEGNCDVRVKCRKCGWDGHWENIERDFNYEAVEYFCPKDGTKLEKPREHSHIWLGEYGQYRHHFLECRNCGYTIDFYETYWD